MDEWLEKQHYANTKYFQRLNFWDQGKDTDEEHLLHVPAQPHGREVSPS